MKQILFSDLERAALKTSINFAKYESVFGIPSGGIYPAAIISRTTGLPMLSQKIYEKTRCKSRVLVVDDLIDSGKTLEKYPKSDSFVCFSKKRKRSIEPTYFYEEISDEWIELPHEKGETGIEEHIERIKEHRQGRESAYIIVQTRFVGFHRWIGAPKEVDFLKAWHRHVFHVRVKMLVDSLNRELEFFIQKAKLNEFLKKYEGQRFELSCEQVAQDIASSFGGFEVEVYEDGENGGGITNQIIL